MSEQFHRDAANAYRLRSAAFSATSVSKEKAGLVALAKAHDDEATRPPAEVALTAASSSSLVKSIAAAVVALLVGLGIGSGVGGGGSTTPPTTIVTTTTIVVSPTARPFLASSAWNTPTPAGTLWFDSPAMHAPVAAGDTVRHYYVNELSMRVVYAKATDPPCTFNLARFVDPTFNRNRPATTMTLPCPVGSMPGTDEDHIYHLRQPDGSYLELWQATRTGDTFTALGWATGSVVTGTGVGTLTATGGNNAGVRAANTSWAAGLITGPEIDAGRIDHALAVMLGYGLLSNTAWRAPATAPDNGGHSGPIQMGTRLGIPPGTPRPAGLSPLGVAVFDALQTYGAFVVDFAGSPYPMFTVDAGTVAEDDPRVRRLFTWWDGWTADMDLISPLIRVADYQPGS